MPFVPAFPTAAALMATLTLAAGAQEPDTKGAAPGVSPVSLTGCLEADPDGGEIRLTGARASTSTEPERSMTSAGAGASATGEGPSGSVSGDTPTGSTSTETSAPTPATGTPDARANPASGDYRRGARDATAGTSGTVPRPEQTSAAPVTRYRVTGRESLGLVRHAGHTVRIDGSLTTDPDAAADEDGPAGRAREPLVTATAIRRVADGCQR